MKKIIIFMLMLLVLSSILLADTQKVAILDFSNSDRESDYVANSLMKRDFSTVFEEFEDIELINIKESKKIFKASGITNLSYAGTGDISSMGNDVTEVQLLEAGVKAIIRKPISPKKVAEALGVN